MKAPFTALRTRSSRPAGHEKYRAALSVIYRQSSNPHARSKLRGPWGEHSASEMPSLADPREASPADLRLVSAHGSSRDLSRLDPMQRPTPIPIRTAARYAISKRQR